jgi:hypothetical protein
MIIFLAVLKDRMLAIRALKSNYAVGELSFLIVFLILHLNQVSAEAGSAMLAFLYNWYDLGAELALGAWVFAFEGVMLEFFLLLKLLTTAFTGNFNVLAVI